LQLELTRLLAVIESIQEEPAVTAGKGTQRATTGDILLLLTNLAEAIDRADPEEILKIKTQVMEHLADATNIEPGTLAALETEISRYDYDQALKTIGYMQKALKENT
jgi:hypothetical protein